MHGLRERPPPDKMLKIRDSDPLIVVPPQTWHCLWCDPGGQGVATTVDWPGPTTDGPHGRCRECGQKYVLAAEQHMPLRAGAPEKTVVAPTPHCLYCEPHPGPATPHTLAWLGLRGECGRCGQGYRLEGV